MQQLLSIRGGSNKAPYYKYLTFSLIKYANFKMLINHVSLQP